MVGPGAGPGLRFAYADPPYPGHAWRYADQASYAGEVDHAALVASLVDRQRRGELAGWALSTSAAALAVVLPLAPTVKVCAWVKPIGVFGAGVCSRWEPVLVSGGRALHPVRDWLSAQPAKLAGSDLVGRKPLAFCGWLFDLLGMVPGDELEDLFPGSGVVGQAWASLSAGSRSRWELNDAAAPVVEVLKTGGRSCRSDAAKTTD